MMSSLEAWRFSYYAMDEFDDFRKYRPRTSTWPLRHEIPCCTLALHSGTSSPPSICKVKPSHEPPMSLTPLSIPPSVHSTRTRLHQGSRRTQTNVPWCMVTTLIAQRHHHPHESRSLPQSKNPARWYQAQRMFVCEKGRSSATDLPHEPREQKFVPGSCVYCQAHDPVGHAPR